MMKWLLALVLLFAHDPPALHVVAARGEVMPGQVFSVTVTSFGDVGAVAFDGGGLEVVTDTVGLPTRYVWLRASGPARDVTIKATAGALSASTVVRVCCRVTSWPGYRLWLASVRR